MSFKRNTLNNRVMNDLKKRSYIGIFFYPVVSVIVLYSNSFYKRHFNESLLFISIVLFISFFRLIHNHFFLKGDKVSSKKNIMVFFISVYFTSLIWGIGFGLVMLLQNEPFTKMIMLASTIGIGSGGVVAFIPEKYLSLFFNTIMVLPAIILMSFFQVNFALPVLMIVYALYMGLIAVRGNKEYWNALETEYLLKKKTEEIKQISQTDLLTNIFNRRYFDQIFDYLWKKCLRSGCRITVIMSDIDYFKKINDNYGHLAGDQYLKMVAELLTSVFQRKTDVVARFGGEEFIILTSEDEDDQILQLTEVLRKKIESSVLDYKDTKIQTTMSFGVASIIPDKKTDYDVLIGMADNALYQAKKEGRNRVIFYN